MPKMTPCSVFIFKGFMHSVSQEFLTHTSRPPPSPSLNPEGPTVLCFSFIIHLLSKNTWTAHAPMAKGHPVLQSFERRVLPLSFSARGS